MSGYKRFVGLLLGVVLTVVAASSIAGDIEQFRALDRNALREAERRLPEMFDRDTGKVLVAPRTEAERYVIARERLWHAQMQEPSRLKFTEEGVRILEHSPAAMATTWLVVDEDGNAVLRCHSGGHEEHGRIHSPPATETVVR